jgi:hypothetical protein
MICFDDKHADFLYCHCFAEPKRNNLNTPYTQHPSGRRVGGKNTSFYVI